LAAGWAGAVTVAPRSAGVLGAILAWSEVASLADSVA
jgi:hypothetical protein